MEGLVTVRIGLVAAVTLVLNAAGWAYALVAQVSADPAIVGSPDTVVTATALTGTAGALVYVVRQMASGKLVHRDPATAEKALASALDRISKIAELSLKREDTLYQLLLERSRRGDRDNRG